MQRKPYLLFFLLLTILAFIIGFRAGQKTEKTNKVIDYVLSVTPSPAPSPVKPVQYKSKKWGIEFTFPSNLSINESTNSPEIVFEPIPPNATGEGSKK